jgi:hypothetical protein
MVIIKNIIKTHITDVIINDIFNKYTNVFTDIGTYKLTYSYFPINLWINKELSGICTIIIIPEINIAMSFEYNKVTGISAIRDSGYSLELIQDVRSIHTDTPLLHIDIPKKDTYSSMSIAQFIVNNMSNKK